VRGDRVVELALVLPEAPSTIREVLKAGPALLRRIEAALHLAPFGHALAAVRLEAPVPDASKYLAIGMNYQDHAEEARRAGLPIPKTQHDAPAAWAATTNCEKPSPPKAQNSMRTDNIPIKCKRTLSNFTEPFT